MEQNYEQVPNIITGKDLDYLSDIFQWNYGAFKTTFSSLEQVEDSQICDLFQRAIELFQNNMNSVLTVLNEGGSHE